MSEKVKLLFDMLLLFGTGFAVCLLSTPIIRSFARRAGLVDRPDGRRKMHSEAIPVAGGVVVFLATAAILIFESGRLPAWRQALSGNSTIFLSLLAASAVIVAVGILDDSRGLRGKVKLLGQLVAVGIVIAGGVRIDSITLFDHRFGDWGLLFSIPITTLWLLLAINSLNLLDGMDGLLGSVGAILCLTLGTLAFLSNNYAAACVAVTLAGSLLGFLWYNFPPATIFLGDAGSMLIGLVVGTLAIQASLKGPATVGLMLPVTLMIIPIFDTTAAIVRRKLTGRSIYTTDRGHLHHMLMGSGLSKRQVLMVVIILSVVVGLGAILSQWQKSELFAVATAMAVVGFLVVFRLFGHSEYLLIKQRLAGLVLNVRQGSQPGRVREIKVHLQGSADWGEIWRELTVAAEELKFRTMCLDVNAPAFHEGYHARWDRSHKDNDEMPGFWRVEIPLSVRQVIVGRLEVIGLRDGDSAWQKLAALAKIVEDLEQSITELVDRKEKKSLESVVA